MTMQRQAGWAAGALGIVLGAVSAWSAVNAQAAPVSYEFVEISALSADAEPAKPATAFSRSVAAPPFAVLGQGYGGEIEPNGSAATATPIAGRQGVIRANAVPNGDVDFYAINADAGDRLYAAVMTAFSASGTTDSQLRVFGPDGTTLIEFDEDDGSLSGLSSTLAGATLPTTGTYYLQLNPFSATTQVRGYELHYRLQAGAPTLEVEPNDTPATANPLPANGWVSGARGVAVATEQDWYSLSLNAGDTVFLSLDLDPERDNVQWDGRLGFGLFGDASNQILVVNDLSIGSVANPLSEAMFLTVKETGTYFAFVDSASAAVGGPTATYHLSVTVQPAADEGVNCTTYTSTNVPQAIGPGAGLVSSTITVPGNPRIADIDVSIQLNHALMNDLDVQLRSPSGNDNGLFTDIGPAATGGQAQMDIIFDDEAAAPPTFTVLRGMAVKPEMTHRLAWFDGEDAGGTWTLDIRDDTTNASGGTLTGWSMRICEPPPPPTCAAGFAPVTVYSTDFEAGAAGFTHSGTADEWELGLPATLATSTAGPVAAFNSCASGTSCWKTDLDNTYNVSSSQGLLSPNINLAGLSPPVLVRWAQRYQMESANFDHYHVDFRQVGGGPSLRLFEWLDATMTNPPGNPVVNIPAASGWSQRVARADALAGQNTELLFHLDSDTTVNFGGAAVDDVSVTACRAQSADLAITKTDGVSSAVPGGSVTYTITASNAGPDAVSAATVADTFPAALTCTWTCVGAGGGTCTAAGAGNLNDAVNLPIGGSVSYTASCTVSAAATGSLSNTATVTSAITDPNPANNSATDTDTLTPQADLWMFKSDGVASVIPGGSTIYVISAVNNGPSDAPGSNIVDTFPVACTSVTWTCVGASGGTCVASGTGNINEIANLPAGGGAVSYSATCTISAAATGTLSNTASVSPAVGITDPSPADNSATDTDTISSQADLSITKTDGVASVAAGGSTVYTIVASNAGPSVVTGATVADTAPAACTSFTWTCVGAGGGTCTAAGSGSLNDSVNLPAGASATYTATCAISAAATGTLSNTATVSSAVTDPVPGNNSATDSNTLVLPGALGVSPSALAFGSVSVGATSPAQTVTLSNSGASPLTVSTLTAAAPPFARTGGSCTVAPIVIAAGASCTLEYSFSPTAAAAAAQTLTVDAGVAGSGTIALGGSGGVGVVGVLNASISFGSQLVGAGAQQALTITNTGSGALQVTGLSAVTAPFTQIAGGSCGAVPFSLAAGASCTVLYAFQPTTLGSFNQTVTVTADVGTATASLLGTAFVPTPVNALSLQMLAMLIAGFGLFGMLMLRRR